MDATKTIGYIAAVLTTVSFLPQVIRTIKRRSAKDLSFGMLALFLAGVAGWLIYGLLLHQMPIIAANGVTLLLVLILFIGKCVYK